MLSRRLLRIKVVKALYAHFTSESDSLIVSEKNLVFSIDKAYELYHLLLSLAVDVRQYALQRIEIGKAKMLPTAEDLNPNTKFVDNRVIERIAASEPLSDYLATHKLSWSNYPELVKRLYQRLVESDYYKEYMASPTRSFRQDRQLVEKFFIEAVEDFEPLEEALEEQSIYWVDDVDFSLILIVKTLQDMEADGPLPLLPEYKNDDDREFPRELFRKALVNHKEYFGYIDANTKNWDLERIAFMDRIVMLAAIAEIIGFPTIPVKVTFDEFIEISKYYCTPSSSTFINGVLDKIVENLKTEGKIEKQGRGLVEN